ncbi:GNAT family N-acetyltransferase [Stenotrophomonas sp.]|uniref:GNAT family N-acetyltransferase n=1 Tax=Stenotrophomonas sp. TaxID=69392 RepID=UPI0028A80ACF|nr:GNAT family N-acetyltransferase [Stenotrophomonas sp.]
MDQDILLRDANAADAVALSALVTPLARHLLDADTGASAHAFLASLTAASFAERLADPDFAHYVIEEAGLLAGMIAMRGGSHIHHLFVSRGTRRRGIARQLWEHALRIHGRREYTVNSSEIAVPVYERFGFVSKAAPQTVKGVRFVLMERPRLVQRVVQKQYLNDVLPVLGKS